MDKDEMRKLTFGCDEIRADGEDGTKVITGHAAVFEQETIVGSYPWGFIESIRKGAFRKTLKESDQAALWNHNSDFPLGRKSAGTLKLKEDKEGLATEIFPPPTQYANDVIVLIDRGDIQGMSFAFRVIKDTWTEPEEGSNELPRREIQELALYEVSPVTFPQYTQTDIGIDARAVLEDAERRGAIHINHPEEDTTSEPDSETHSADDEPGNHSSDTAEPEGAHVHSIEAGLRRRRMQRIQSQREAEMKSRLHGGPENGQRRTPAPPGGGRENQRSRSAA